MNISFQLSAEAERRLQQEAARNGLTVAEHIARLAEQSVSLDRSTTAAAAETWEAQWRAWAAPPDFGYTGG